MSALAEGPDYSAVQRNLALELVRVTEAAALASGRWQGRGEKNAADQAAVDAMRVVLNSVQMDGVVVIGEGEKDEVSRRVVLRLRVRRHLSMTVCTLSTPLPRTCHAHPTQAPMLYRGERIGDGLGPEVDVAVDPLDGTSLTAQGRNGAVSVIAVASRGALFDPGPCM